MFLPHRIITIDDPQSPTHALPRLSIPNPTWCGVRALAHIPEDVEDGRALDANLAELLIPGWG